MNSLRGSSRRARLDASVSRRPRLASATWEERRTDLLARTAHRRLTTGGLEWSRRQRQNERFIELN
jgi:hypothetical protein